MPSDLEARPSGSDKLAVELTAEPSIEHPFPRLRWLAPLWLAVYLPAYYLAYGLANFIFLCNIGVIFAAAGLWLGHRLLLSASAVASLFVGLIWSIDFGSRVATGEHLLGVTAYMWDPQFPLFTRALSLYHVGWPLLMLFCMAKIGYDRRGWVLQAAIATPLVAVGRLAGDATENINYAFTDPLWGRQLGPVPVHLLTVIAATAFAIYGGSHALLTARYALSTAGEPDELEAESLP
jgi:hypothetical protein